MAADNQTTIAGNLVDTPELRFANTGTPSPTSASRSPNASSTTASGATARPHLGPKVGPLTALLVPNVDVSW